MIDMRAGGGDVKVRRHRHSVVRYEERSPSVTVVAKKRYAKKRTRIYSSAPVRSRTTVVERRKPAAVVRSRTTIQRTVDEPRSSVRVRDETGGVSARTTTRSRTTTTTTEGRSGSAGGASTSTTGSGGAAATVGGSAGSGR
ncbi:hypothetical protein CCR97_21635 [Rhodoplanes elegans]|uniref:Uncharacterized protein n=1 Tax=Rhodoplanes elegans TaxID=29408 RepID=A0A327KED0_9BRAD|nr:hypothetical protein [Rhodoplanes elegans]RAI37139.1 hypothetical protein CH338_16615 [Rhodoplanes elegans]